jgi:hypothetical protein
MRRIGGIARTGGADPWILEPQKVIGARPIRHDQIDIAVAVDIRRSAVRRKLYSRERDARFGPVWIAIPLEISSRGTANDQIFESVAIDIRSDLDVTSHRGVDNAFVQSDLGKSCMCRH